MKRLPVIIAIAVVLVTALLVTSVAAVPIPCEDEDLNGNCAPSGNHFTLNLIGKDKTDILPNDANSGHRIFVNLYANFESELLPKNKIYLTNTTSTTNDFRVFDADATDGRGEFGLPGATGYVIYIRELGKPDGTGRLTTCYTNVTTQEDWCIFGYVDVPLERRTGKSVFRDVTEELTQLCYLEDPEDPESDIICESIFSDALKNYFWNYDNNGLKNVQLRFYPV